MFRKAAVFAFMMVVGLDGVLSNDAGRPGRCGSRLVSGLFARPRLPLGYSLVATVPRGACRLNVSEIQPSENYIALKVANSTFIMNGEFAVSSPGAYEAAGARFVYTRTSGQDVVFAHGPLLEAIDIMVLYTQPNPKIRYEYYTESPDETSNDIPIVNAPEHHHHRHHNAEITRALERSDSYPSLTKPEPTVSDSEQLETNVIGDRRFTWKILSFSQCSRSCGGGLQFGKFKCVEEGERDKEVSMMHCSGSPPPSRRRRCGAAPCPPRWRAAAWGQCPMCGPAQRTRIVGCVQDHARGITKISDQKCPLPMPSSSEQCNIPNCDGSALKADAPKDTRRQVHTRDHTDAFREGPTYQLTGNISEGSQGYSFSAVGGWLHTEWSECVGWCVGGGVQSRSVRCADPAGCESSAPAHVQTCKPRAQCHSHDGQWFTGEWSACSAACGGRQVRGVLCVGGAGRRLRDAACKAKKPERERACGGDCAPAWYTSDWGECQGPCEAGTQNRAVWCAKEGAGGASGAGGDAHCSSSRPAAKRACVPARCSTRPVPAPALLNPTASATDAQQRVTRHQIRNQKNTQNLQNEENKKHHPADGQCKDRLNNCLLAVQARLCHYHYYSEYCCQSCRAR